MKKIEIKDRRILISLIVIGVMALTLAILFIIKSIITTAEPTTNFNSNLSTDANSNNGPFIEPLTDMDFYNLGLNQLGESNFSEAIASFDRAINMNPENRDFYIRKSQAQYSLKDKSASIATIKAGLLKIPNDPQLLARLDALQKEAGNNFNLN